MKRIVEKKLSPNDVGTTGAHQAGILIPKKSDLLDFFPELDVNAENPRTMILFADDVGKLWKFNFIYYNNRLRGGTRNEYRLTGMTAYLRQVGAKAEDLLVFENDDGDYSIRIRNAETAYDEDDGVVSLVLDDNWKIIKY